jgi:hypothetical protein
VFGEAAVSYGSDNDFLARARAFTRVCVRAREMCQLCLLSLTIIRRLESVLVCSDAMLDNPAADEYVREQAIRRALERGVTREMAEHLFGKPKSAD